MGPEEQILRLLFVYPTRKFSYREFERNLDISIGSISKYIPILEKKGLVHVECMPNAKYVTANLSKDFRILKRIGNLAILNESRLVSHLEMARPKAMILFGSFEKGEDIEDSDIDICVIGGKKEVPDCKSFGKSLAREINIVHLDELTRTSREFRQTLANGFVLSGYLAI